ncbi:tyrosine kinase receptor Cad96Ca [Cotesia glomerata]|uniref:tyrosine kinase receptor Cad96Ca n=1 Tax=Cotesia glomerata TaxID=32391 RepID=UPI001D02E91E|nr:tyrosine kinase receptor Cad96Ca [Cotesia glomerata]
MIIRWIIVVALATFTYGQLSDNTPPVMILDRNWILLDSAPKGTFVTRVHAKDNEQDQLNYGLEALDHNFNGDSAGSSSTTLPFFINSLTGEIVTNDTLKGRGGEKLFLYVTASDGKLTAKNEVYVVIKNSSSTSTTNNNSNNNNGPFSQNSQNFNLGLNHQSMRSPFLAHFSNSQLPSFSRPVNSTKTHEKTTVLRPAEINISNYVNQVINGSSMTSGPNVYNTSTLDSLSVQDSTYSYQNITMTTVGTISAILAVILIVGMALWSVRRKICSHKKSKHPKELAVKVSDMSSPNEPSLILKNFQNYKFSSNKYQEWNKSSKESTEKDEWEFPRHRLKVFCILGEGCFGQVWKCEAIDINGSGTGVSVVAVKTLKENATERERIDLAQELTVMKTLEPHPNVVRLLGCCTEREPIFVIMEYISGGKLQSFLRNMREEKNSGRPGLTSRDLTGFVHQIAKGMAYLASKGIIHRDLAARNILIDSNRLCKIADFGFARDIAANKIYERKSDGRLPIRWMAPESLYDNMYSVKSDIWSFGVLTWEIVTLGSTPYPGMGAAEVMRKIKEGYRLERPEHCKRELYNIMYYCWDKDPSCRPSFGELVAMAEGLLLDEIDYIELDRFPDHSYYNVLNLSGEKL